MARWKRFVPVLVVALVLVASGGVVNAEGGTGVTNGDPAFDAAAATWEGYWYSRVNFLNLAMMAGLGPTFAPPMDMMQGAMKMVDADPNDGDMVRMPVNPAMLQAVYRGGDPHFGQALQVKDGFITDFASARWDASTFDRALVPSAQAQTILKEIEWSRFFHNSGHFGTPSDNFGAQQRFMGIALMLEAQMQLQFAAQNLMNSDGLFVTEAVLDGETVRVTDPSVQPADQYQMLMAIVDAARVVGDQATYPRYFNAGNGAMFAMMADQVFQSAAGLVPNSVKDRALAIRAFTWYASVTQDSQLQVRALGRIDELAGQLAQATPSAPIEAARSIKGLVDADRALGTSTHAGRIAGLFGRLEGAYNAERGVFDGQNTYTAWDVGDYLGALNTLRVHKPEGVDQAEVDRLFAGFFEGVVNLGGLQLAAPPKGFMMGQYEAGLPDLFYRHPALPMPPMAGGDFGSAPVMAAETTFDPASASWTAGQDRFDTAGAMHAANEFIWFLSAEVNGYPTVTKLAAAPAPTATAAPTAPPTPTATAARATTVTTAATSVPTAPPTPTATATQPPRAADGFGGSTVAIIVGVVVVALIGGALVWRLARR